MGAVLVAVAADGPRVESGNVPDGPLGPAIVVAGKVIGTVVVGIIVVVVDVGFVWDVLVGALTIENDEAEVITGSNPTFVL